MEKLQTSLSDVPQSPQDLHSIHCQGYFFTEMIILAENCRHEGCPGMGVDVMMIGCVKIIF